MAEFCSDDCEKLGSICDFCEYYLDEYRDIKKLKREDGSETDASSGYNCNNFKCFRIKE